MCSRRNNYVLGLVLESDIQINLKTFYVVILKNADISGWWDVFTFWKWRHVLVFWEVTDRENFWFTQSLEYVLGRVNVVLYLVSPQEWLDGIVKTGQVIQVIEWRIDKIEPFRYNLRGLMTCTSVIKAVIGVNAPFVFNPKQLSRELLSLGGEVIWAEADQAKQRKPD